MGLRSTALIAALLFLTGCAATVKKGPSTSSLRVPAEAAQKIVLNMSGPPRSSGSRDWEAFKGEWNGSFRAIAGQLSVAFEVQDGKAKSTGENGTLLEVYVDDYRYLSPGARYGFGIMTGNAYIESKIRFLDLKTGALYGEQAYNTTSTAWQGVFSAMTEKQVDAIAAEVVYEITGRRLVAAGNAGSSVTSTGKQERAVFNATGLPAFAEVGDVDAVPALSLRGKDGYREWLTKPMPRAFVISEQGRWASAWKAAKLRNPADPMDPTARALKHCKEGNGVNCTVYAVDDRVVFTSFPKSDSLAKKEDPPTAPAPQIAAAKANAKPVAVAEGQESYQVEHLEEIRACSPTPRATLASKSAGAEMYSVLCANGDLIFARCEMGNCRVLR